MQTIFKRLLRLQTMRSASSSGTAISAPAMPHSQPHTITDRNTDTGASRKRRPITIGLTKFASIACSARNAAGGANISSSVP